MNIFAFTRDLYKLRKPGNQVLLLFFVEFNIFPKCNPDSDPDSSHWWCQRTPNRLKATWGKGSRTEAEVLQWRWGDGQVVQTRAWIYPLLFFVYWLLNLQIQHLVSQDCDTGHGFKHVFLLNLATCVHHDQSRGHFCEIRLYWPQEARL